jgi:hypothetical protein
MTHTKKVFSETLKIWVPLAIVIVVLSGLVYVAVQQNYRLSANDPQIQIAEDIASAISKGTTPPDAIVSANPTAEMSPSLATFVTIFSATGTPIGSSVAENGKLPTLPSSIFDYVKKHGQDKFTWQPESGTRIAAVVNSFSGPQPGYILAGRSLREVEARERQLTLMTIVATAVALVVSFLAVWLFAQMMGVHDHKDSEVA